MISDSNGPCVLSNVFAIIQMHREEKVSFLFVFSFFAKDFFLSPHRMFIMSIFFCIPLPSRIKNQLCNIDYCFAVRLTLFFSHTHLSLSAMTFRGRKKLSEFNLKLNKFIKSYLDMGKKCINFDLIFGIFFEIYLKPIKIF